MVILNAHFDGRSIVLDEPLSLPLHPGARLKIRVETVDEDKNPKAPPTGFAPLNIRIQTELSNAIALDPEFGIEES
jgi:hypothetical protein